MTFDLCYSAATMWGAIADRARMDGLLILERQARGRAAAYLMAARRLESDGRG